VETTFGHVSQVLATELCLTSKAETLSRSSVPPVLDLQTLQQASSKVKDLGVEDPTKTQAD
jgi:hypothetical protein